MNNSNKLLGILCITIIVLFTIKMFLENNQEDDCQDNNQEDIKDKKQEDIKDKKQEDFLVVRDDYQEVINADTQDTLSNQSNLSSFSGFSSPKENDPFVIPPLKEKIHPFQPISKVDSHLITNKIYAINPKSREQFNNEFFSFRDITHNNTSIQEDPVDRFQEVYLNNLEKNNSLQNNSLCNSDKPVPIKDLYDNIVSANADLYKQPCARSPQYDSVNNSNMQNFTKISNNNNVYYKEKSMNGATMWIESGPISGINPEDSNFYPVARLGGHFT